MEKLSDQTLSAICWQLSLLCGAGIPSQESLTLMAQGTSDRALAALLGKVADALEDGGALSAALAASGAFPAHLVRMLEIGEASGRSDQVFASLSAYYKREGETRRALRRAMTYPAVMAGLVAVVFTILLSRVLPVFSQVFRQVGLTPSPLVQGLLSLGSVSQYIAAGLCVLLVGGALLLTLRVNRGETLPLGKAGKAVDRSRFASAMSLMLSSGLPLDEAMERTCRLLEGSTLSTQVEHCRQQVAEGAPFACAVEGCGLLSGLDAGLLSAGVRGGAAAEAMGEVATRCQEEADDGLNRLLSRFEFSLVLLLCLAVGLVLLSVMLPLVGVLSAIG